MVIILVKVTCDGRTKYPAALAVNEKELEL